MKICSHPLTAPPFVTFPEVRTNKHQRITWQIQLCKKRDKKGVMLPEMTTIVNQTDKQVLGFKFQVCLTLLLHSNKRITLTRK